MIYPFDGVTPRIHETAYVAKNASVIGDITLSAHSSVWPGAVLRADFSSITIGKYTSVQDNCVIHVEGSLEDIHAPELPVVIREYCTIGHGAILHGCTLGNRVLVGSNAVIFNGVTVGDGAIIGMGSVIPDNKEIPSKSVVVGVPGKVVRTVTEEEWERAKIHAELYATLADRYKTII
ncbi:MAG: gamma carbonic anhydrase family protein [Theionarchaea archaeon]|nr:gamma carbonic anhydrase family protein [Theionarchaea archaeon]